MSGRMAVIGTKLVGTPTAVVTSPLGVCRETSKCSTTVWLLTDPDRRFGGPARGGRPAGCQQSLS